VHYAITGNNSRKYPVKSHLSGNPGRDRFVFDCAHHHSCIPNSRNRRRSETGRLRGDSCLVGHISEVLFGILDVCLVLHCVLHLREGAPPRSGVRAPRPAANSSPICRSPATKPSRSTRTERRSRFRFFEPQACSLAFFQPAGIIFNRWRGSFVNRSSLRQQA
jgi:hypothetical protein